ncbi:hypothetical protein [uncultured Sphingomonas sp.]|uniref:hypothetical protein n=1 Tax=uncultured Sphingomonas sp. TaxID=158754 RepID=UPI0035CC6BE9
MEQRIVETGDLLKSQTGQSFGEKPARLRATRPRRSPGIGSHINYPIVLYRQLDAEFVKIVLDIGANAIAAWHEQDVAAQTGLSRIKRPRCSIRHAPSLDLTGH